MRHERGSHLFGGLELTVPHDHAAARIRIGRVGGDAVAEHEIGRLRAGRAEDARGGRDGCETPSCRSAAKEATTSKFTFGHDETPLI